MTYFLFVNIADYSTFLLTIPTKGNSLKLPPRLPYPILTSAYKNDDTDPVPEISQGNFSSL